MLIQYRPDKKFRSKTVSLIAKANEIIAEYIAQGYALSLRQLYYQLVSQNVIENSEKSYKRISDVMSDARYAGQISWEALEDRTRSVRSLSHWKCPSEIIESASRSFHHDLWRKQRNRVEVWVEKDALTGVLERVCNRNDVSYFSCRGNTSTTEMWRGAQRLRAYQRQGQQPCVLYLGDHDPSGLDMSRDVEQRLNEFGASAIVRRLALNLDQIERWRPPPQPAKQSDSRYREYVRTTGQKQSWELDALDPTTLSDLVENAIKSLRDPSGWQEAIEEQEQERKLLINTSEKWESVAAFLATSTTDSGNSFQ